MSLELRKIFFFHGTLKELWAEVRLSVSSGLNVSLFLAQSYRMALEDLVHKSYTLLLLCFFVLPFIFNEWKTVC